MNIKKIIALGILTIIVIQIFGIYYNSTMDHSTRLKEFDNLNDLNIWLLHNDVSDNTYINNTYDCEDFAIDLVNDAIQDGYLIYSMGSGTAWVRTILMYNQYNDTTYYGYEFVELVNHAYCITKIDNIWYMIEPQNDIITELGEEI